MSQRERANLVSELRQLDADLDELDVKLEAVERLRVELKLRRSRIATIEKRIVEGRITRV